MTASGDGMVESDSDVDVVEGVVVRVTFANEETGFRVVRVKAAASQSSELPGLVVPRRAAGSRRPPPDADSITVVGVLPPLAPGESIRAIGRFQNDPKHGPQLRASMVSVVTPTTVTGLERYLGGGVIKGIAKRTARKIVETFGEDAVRVLDSEPDRLREVPGLGATRAERLAREWRAHRASRELMVALASFGVPPSTAQRIHRRYGDGALEVVRRAPYRLALEVWGVGFRSADAIAQQMGIAADDPQRAQAGVLHTVQAQAEEGHTATPRPMLVERAARLLAPTAHIDRREDRHEPQPVDATFLRRADEAIDALVDADVLFVAPEGITHRPLGSEEIGLARALCDLLDESPTTCPRRLPGVQAAIAAFEHDTGVTLAPAQRDAIELVARARVAVVTGGPGVGKTTVVRAILALFDGARLRTALAAPTGRAAKRMTEATGREASTIHRLLELDPRKRRFARDDQRPLECDAIVIDEASMVDVPLAYALVRAVPRAARLVIVGDVEQLPSIGPGAVLRDLIASGVVPTARMSEVFRQAGESAIVAGAHAILRGETPPFSARIEPDRQPGERQAGRAAPVGQLFMIERREPDEAARTIVDVVADRMPKAFGFDPRRDVQVLVPMVRGAVGARALNVDLQARLNAVGPSVRRGETHFRVGDRVMQTRNDYDREVFNGDLGYVVSLGGESSTGDDSDDIYALMVRFEDGREVAYEDAHLDELALAYATTIHKSQGSEYPAVVIGLVNQHYVMLARKLLYTAVTRARRLAVIVGTRWALQEAIRDARGEERRTMLTRLLRG